ncbi:uncharacterized protein LOC101855448 [Aplysia californica]|uniref:Uncharacterized protein LOC101855448 n=1 Tax=Aplysia californica TaxID=6500 RepID=A0ABM0K770_APLCA|nr:uncharacterized protein LOC101855448 [Aplysia californica]
MTFELIDGVTGARLQTSSSGIFMVNATAVAKFYRCASLFNGIKKESRYNITVQGKDARAVGISGPSEWEVGVPATLKCETVSLNNTKISYQWLKKVLDSTPLPGETGETLTVTSPKAEFALYTCLVTTPGGTKDEASVEFSVVQDLSTPPYVSYDARPLNLGGRYTLECHSNFGETAVTYKWTKDGVVLPSTSNNYVIPSMAAKDAGKYSCSVTVNGKTLEAKNPFEVDTPGAKGKACKAALFTATCSGEEYTGNCLAGRCECSPGAELQQNGCALSVASSAPTVVSDVTTAMNLGGRYILICASTASVTGATYTWTKDGQTLPYTSATLEIPSMSLTDVGEYACRITVNGNTSPQAAAFSVRPRAVQPGQPVTDDPNPGTRVSVSLLVFTVTLLCGLVVRQET